MSKHVIDLSQPVPVPQSLEEAQQLNTHSENSSKPPSQDSPKQRAERPSKKPSGRAEGDAPLYDPLPFPALACLPSALGA
jgi:hypothetical protein